MKNISGSGRVLGTRWSLLLSNIFIALSRDTSLERFVLSLARPLFEIVVGVNLAVVQWTLNRSHPRGTTFLIMYDVNLCRSSPVKLVWPPSSY